MRTYFRTPAITIEVVVSEDMLRATSRKEAERMHHTCEDCYTQKRQLFLTPGVNACNYAGVVSMSNNAHRATL